MSVEFSRNFLVRQKTLKRAFCGTSKNIIEKPLTVVQKATKTLCSVSNNVRKVLLKIQVIENHENLKS